LLGLRLLDLGLGLLDLGLGLLGLGLLRLRLLDLSLLRLKTGGRLLRGLLLGLSLLRLDLLLVLLLVRLLLVGRFDRLHLLVRSLICSSAIEPTRTGTGCRVRGSCAASGRLMTDRLPVQGRRLGVGPRCGGLGLLRRELLRRRLGRLLGLVLLDLCLLRLDLLLRLGLLGLLR